MKRAGLRSDVGDPRRVLDLAREPETSVSPKIPLLEFTDNVIDMHIFTQTVSVARRWNLRGRSEVPGENTMCDLLARRYRYATDGIPHRDLFDCIDKDGNLLTLLDIPADRGDDGHCVRDTNEFA